MKILAVLPRFPWPLEKGDKLRAFYQLKTLAQRHEVHLACLNDNDVDEQARAQLNFCKSITVVRHGRTRIIWNLLGSPFRSEPLQVCYYQSPELRKVLSQLIERLEIDVVFVQLVRMGMNLPFSDKCAWYLDYMDAFSIGMSGRARQGSWWKRWGALIEAARLKRYEAAIATHFDGYSIISDRDAAAFPAELRRDIMILPNGVGESFLEIPAKPIEKQYDLVFFGNMGYQPNIQSARFLMEEVVPLLHLQGILPKICLAGARPAAAIRCYAGDDVTVTGFVDDIRVCVLQSRLAIAPIVGGQGLQNKLLESMALGVPTLTSTLAHEAISAKAGEDIVVCAKPEEYADRIAFLLTNPHEAEAIGKSGKAYVERNYRWEAVNRRLEKALEGAARMRRRVAVSSAVD